MGRIFILAALFLSAGILAARPNENYLEEYVKTGLKNNLELQGAGESLKVYKARESQSVANFMPRLDLTSRFSKAGGGRSFVFPLGSMLNPLYEYAKLPIRLTDEKMTFIRPQEQDSKLELVQPVLNMAIIHGYNAQAEQYESAKKEYEAKSQNLVYSIKEAYYNYAKARQLNEIRKSAYDLANDNLNMVTKLVEADRVPQADKLRAEVMVFGARQELSAAENMAALARNNFNRLLNRNFDSAINYDSTGIEDLLQPEAIQSLDAYNSIDDAIATALKSRPELSQLALLESSASHGKKAVESENIPSISLVADYGIQGERYTFDSDSRYWMASAVLQWNLFSGFGTKAKSEEMEAQINALRKTSESTKQMICLEVKNNFLDYRNSFEMLAAAEKAYKSSEEGWRINKAGYTEGIIPYISLLDAQNTLTMTRANFIVTYYGILTAKSKLEKSMGIIR